ncbi:hypothetical protein Hypma_013151 [Hypsizygus marmoreus]|uniref:Uncharacterized protein n=1 Tax=Hypsizygus marmoreus TaxID=39966 RepID=A0A369JF05_HYPMA|nr:hypothetical protein Hypma_013151 [Hypsizygus marmoreus]
MGQVRNPPALAQRISNPAAPGGITYSQRHGLGVAGGGYDEVGSADLRKFGERLTIWTRTTFRAEEFRQSVRRSTRGYEPDEQVFPAR